MIWNILNLVRRVKNKDAEYSIKSSSSIKMFWWNGHLNFGDVLNEVLVAKYMKNEIEWVPFNYIEEHYMCIGSILQKANASSIIWGSGLIDGKLMPYGAPKNILSVRGRLTRNALISNGYKCPEKYGDSSLILRSMVDPSVDKIYKIGIIPHYTEKVFVSEWFKDNKDIFVIDIETSDAEKFVSEIKSCEKIVSSSLHGLILSDLYEVPNVWVRFKGGLFGGDFKFLDYYSSCNSYDRVCAELASPDDIFHLSGEAFKILDIDCLGDIESTCPF